MKQNLLIGFDAIKEAIENGKTFEVLFLQKGFTGDRMKQLITLAGRAGIRKSFVPIEKLNRITRKEHQGMVAFLSLVEFASLENIVQTVFENGELPLIVVCDGITDVHNFGAICRSAFGAGAHAVLTPDKRSAQINPDTVKASAGTLPKIPICRTQNLSKSIQYLKNSGVKIVGLSEKSTTSIYDTQLNDPLAIILGAEDVGISKETRELLDIEVCIPMMNELDSLNVSVSAGIALFETVRKRSGA